MSTGIQFLPLTSEQKARLDKNGNRIWTEQEQRIQKSNAVVYDKLREILTRRCAAPECGYAISSLEECFRVPFIGDVCGVCYYMHEALQHPGLKSVFYFRNLHNKWKEGDDPNSPKKRDKLGL